MVIFQQHLDTIYKEIIALPNTGKVASYIPELATVSATKFGIHLIDINQNIFSNGDSQEKFSIQSISKVLSLSKALQCIGENVWERVDVEPSGDPFNHLSLLELEYGIPRNPLINAGAIVIADILVSQLTNPKEDFLIFIRELANDTSINYDENVAKSLIESHCSEYM